MIMHAGAISRVELARRARLSPATVSALVEDLRRLQTKIAESQNELLRQKREGNIPADIAAEEQKRLDGLSAKNKKALASAVAAADTAAKAVTSEASAGIRPLLEADLGEARRLDKATHALRDKLEEAGDKLAQNAIERLYNDTRKVLDKAKLGKIDAIIGQKRKLDIEVQDLAAGRFPEELIGKLWNASMIGDDEEYWPWQGEFWADEYKGWR